MSPAISRSRLPTGGVPLLAVTRAGRVESAHSGSVAVVGGDGRLLAAAGDPLQPVFLRSAAKPLQLIPFLAGGGEKRFRLSLKEVALAAASHSGEPFHTRLALAMLEKGGFSVRDLHCGAHAPLGDEAARELSVRGERAGALHNNCSGKHAAMLLACRLFRLDPRGYWKPGHPLQKRILAVVARMAAVPEKEIGLGVDGCSVPVYQLPLYNLALSYARLLGGRIAAETAREHAARKRIVFAMTRAPEMVAGTRRFTTLLMREYGGALLAKEGYEGVYAVGAGRTLAGALPDGAQSGPLGIALKIEDGGERGRDAIVIEILRQLRFASGARLARLRSHAVRAVRNVRGDVVGGMQPVFSLSLFAAGREGR